MWKNYYGKEPFDLRLAVLRLLYKLPFIAAVTLLGTLLFGGGYYLKNVALRGQRLYAATSFYRLEYAVDSVEDMMNVFINEMSWNTYVHSGMFLDAVNRHLTEEGGAEIDNAELEESIEAFVLSDVRIPSTVVTTDSPEESVRIAHAVEAAMTREMAGLISEIEEAVVIEPGITAEEVIPHTRVGRAFVFGALMSCFFAVTILLLKEAGDDSIWLPSSLWRRYGLRSVGTVESKELAENMRYFFRGEAPGKGEKPHGTAVCAAQPRTDSAKVLEELRKLCPDIVDEKWIALPLPLEDPEVCGKLREMDGILLAVKAGSHAGRQLERVLDHLAQQDCNVTAAILWDADEKLIKRYNRVRFL